MLKRSRGGTQPLPLSREDLVRATLVVLEHNGVDGLTVRAVAEQLGISSPAVYHYFPGREALIDRLCEEVAAEVDVNIPAGIAWDDAIVRILLNMDDTFARYPGVAARVLAIRKPSSAADRITTAVHQSILDGGFQAEQAEQMLLAVHYVFGGWLLGRPARRGAPLAGTDSLEQAIRWLIAGATHDPGRPR